ncbi:FHA domain-containing protein [Myxococcota bacterium]|nr:FHA domain-containing protein [Myxococcota bacterium]
MAAIRKLGHTSAARLLAPLQVMGRAPSCRIVDADGHVSGVHAELRWDGARWLVEDLGSRNGTWLAGVRLRPRSPAEISQGARLALGRPQNAWLFESVEPPVPMAERPDGTVIVAVGDSLALPDQDEPEVVVCPSPEGEWVIETEEGAQRTRSGAIVTVGGVAWTLHLPEVLSQTLTRHDEAATPRTVQLSMVVYPALDQAEVWVRHGTQTLPVGKRAVHRLLRVLVDARLQDQAAGVEAQEEGWRRQVEVARAMGVQPNALNVAIHRLRRQFGSAGLKDASGVVERRITEGQVRLGIADLQRLEG